MVCPSWVTTLSNWCVSQVYKNINDQLKLKNNSKMRQLSLFKDFVFIWNSAAHKSMGGGAKGKYVSSWWYIYLASLRPRRPPAPAQILHRLAD